MLMGASYLDMLINQEGIYQNMPNFLIVTVIDNLKNNECDGTHGCIQLW